MQHGKYNILVDAFHGSSGKGKMSSYLAYKYRPSCLVSTNMPNAGHTVVIDDLKFVSKILPTAAFLNNAEAGKALDFEPYCPKIFIGPTAAFTIDRFNKEVGECQLKNTQIFIHERASIVTDEQKQYEATTEDGPMRIASTMQGSGKCLSDKILRNAEAILAKDKYEEIAGLVLNGTGPAGYMPFLINSMMPFHTFLHEISQGIGLDISNGSHYPNCTSRSTNSIQGICDMGVNLKHLGDIYLNVHATPIRVGHYYDKNGNKMGDSGDFYGDAKEISWADVAKASGMPDVEAERLAEKQRTTVTGRIRRVFEFSFEGLKRAAVISSATKIILNFAQYLDWNVHQARTQQALTPKVLDFIAAIENATGLKVAFVGTGEDIRDVVDLTDSSV